MTGVLCVAPASGQPSLFTLAMPARPTPYAASLWCRQWSQFIADTIWFFSAQDYLPVRHVHRNYLK